LFIRYRINLCDSSSRIFKTILITLKIRLDTVLHFSKDLAVSPPHHYGAILDYIKNCLFYNKTRLCSHLIDYSRWVLPTTVFQPKADQCPDFPLRRAAIKQSPNNINEHIISSLLYTKKCKQKTHTPYVGFCFCCKNYFSKTDFSSFRLYINNATPTANANAIIAIAVLGPVTGEVRPTTTYVFVGQ